MTVIFMAIVFVTEPTSGYELKAPHSNQQCLGPAQHQAGGLRVTWSLTPLATGL